MPLRAISIIPLENVQPNKTPAEATNRTCLKGAALDPMAELMKFTASLLTPTNRFTLARSIRKIMTQYRNSSI
jgi:hypothetical protein